MRGRKAYAYGLLYTIFVKHFTIKEKAILIESMLGKEFTGNPYAIAKYLVTQDEYKNHKFYLVIPNSKKHLYQHEFSDKNIRFIHKDSIRYCYALAICKWLINDNTFSIYFSRRHEQKHLNTWHGTPLKTLGRNFKTDTFKSINNAARNFMHSSLLLAPNQHTETVLKKDFMLEEIWQGKFINIGYPRNDVLFNSINKLNTSENIIIAFMPTWRGTLSSHDRASILLVEQLQELLSYLDTHLKPNITIHVRLHSMVNSIIDLKQYKNIKSFPNTENTYNFLAKCDALVTDYSSVLFDFAVTGRPIFLYTPDQNNYNDERGFYIEPNELPFPIITEKNCLADELNSFQENYSVSAESYKHFQQTYCSWDKGNSTKTLCDAFFNPKSEEKVNTTNKISILIYVGALMKNGIITSFKTLLPLIDTDKYDVTILADTGHNVKEAEQYFSSLPVKIRFIPLYLRVFMTPIELLKIVYLYVLKRKWENVPSILEKVFQREFYRIFGNTHFDVFVNYNGYSWRAALLALGAPCPSVIYVHNEMDKEIKANRVADTRLLKLSYRISSGVAVIRKGAEQGYCDQHLNYREKMFYVPNPLLIDIQEKAKLELKYAFSNGNDALNFNSIQQALEKEGVIRFVNLGRFSPEKGQLRLIDAFEKFHSENPNSQLYIIGGHGSIKRQVEEYAQQSQASNAIFVVTGSSNPFPLVKYMDAFIFSSTYEGIGLVLFEVMQLDVPIISTDIPGPSEFLKQGYGLVVENSIEGLLNGMQQAALDKIPKLKYDFDAHNLNAIQQFYKILDFAINNQVNKKL